MRYLAFCTCLLLLIIKGALSTSNTTQAVDGNTTHASSSMSTAGLNVSTTQPSYISSPNASSSNATMENGAAAGTTTPQANTTTCLTNNACPGDASRTTTVPPHLTPNMTTITHSPDHMTSAPSNHIHNATNQPEHEQPLKGGTATLLAFPNTVFWAFLAVVLCNQ